ncbi:hypothetical protein KIH31_06345 [Paenarthrobacter sp. DKR-5]|uniref:hypothetical protein n=1 Tax=Paenarthrobacter sp. DKR-5 TaxID=2835535 RepID=UPI001BDC40C6|nr:hypothetical protein [Paenarthrobacter sp. DKR-5]MBT1002216.1 hypothetical protein [Paenarthrobacter sp. DKR-5]
MLNEVDQAAADVRDDAPSAASPTIEDAGKRADPEPDALAPVEPDVTDIPVKVCSKCSVQTRTVGNFCPNCGAAYISRKPRLRMTKRTAFISLAVVVFVAIFAAIGLGIQHNNELKAQQDAASAAAEASASASASASAEASASAAAKEASDEAARDLRKSYVSALEASIVKDAKSRVTDGTLDGPILSASCTPLGGGSVDDLTSLTGTFECIAVNKKNSDGSASGYRFSATIDWNEGSYSWHLGS